MNILIPVIVYFAIGFIISSIAFKYKWDDGQVDDSDFMFVTTIFWPFFVTMILMGVWIKILKSTKENK